MLFNNTKYWNKFYKKHTLIIKPSNFSQFIKKEFLKKKKIKNILEIGCGNGRDTFYFSKYATKIVSIDNSQQAIIKSKNNERMQKNIIFLKKNILSRFNVVVKNFDLIYARFFLHTINSIEEDIFLNLLKKISNKKTIVALEFRTTKDKLFKKGKKISKNESITDHYRRFVEVSNFKNKLKKLNFKIIYFKQSVNLSNFKNDNPHLCRIVFKNVK
jgi:SAM-dependent methyltransferase|tara:strand:- start:1776 stop:2420 length:645 start_codon:yes stop_codon:yes gene_type:complete